eukprot:TRINITY_DN14444_c0_g1_i1.p1 TRINITY_DN14444_c0_g1~~TRINITY_DN14444_c0_g1_i1.p1  ORF type:complete len:176 (-),score=33.57 TRINITY_DN14444_c0_g1_i1:305-832(-)
MLPRMGECEGAWRLDMRRLLVRTFAHHDADGSGYASSEDLRLVIEELWGVLSEDEWAHILKVVTDVKEGLYGYANVADETIVALGPPLPRRLRQALTPLSLKLGDDAVIPRQDVCAAISDVAGGAIEAEEILNMLPRCTEAGVTISELERLFAELVDGLNAETEVCELGPVLLSN